MSHSEEWSEGDFSTLLKHLDLPQHLLCEKLPHLSIASLRGMFEALHRFHVSGDTAALSEPLRQRLLTTKKALVCPICHERFRATARTLPVMLADLEKLQPGDFDADPYGALEQLRVVADEIRKLPNRFEALPSLFATLERLGDADVGSPGPLVHLIEEIDGHEDHLLASLQRRPTACTVWMGIRLLNGRSGAPDQDRWRAALGVVRSHPDATPGAREEAARLAE